MKKPSLPLAVVHEKVAALTPVQRWLMLAATVLVLLAGFYFLHYKGQSERIRRVKGSISEQETKLGTLKQAAARVDVLQKELNEAEEEFSRLLSLLPDQKEIPGLLDSVSQLGAQVGLENILFQPQPEQPHEFYASIPIRLDLVGSYHKLGVFFDNVSKLDRILKVDNLSMNRARGSSNLEVGCTVVTYRFLEKPGQGPPPKK